MSPLLLTHGGALSNLPLFLALDAGLFAAHGLAVEAAPLERFGATADRLREGRAAMGTTGFTQVLADADAADPLVVVAGSGMRGMALVGRAGADIASLAGGTVGVFADDPMQVLLADVLARHGLEGRVTVRFLESLREGAEALAAGEVAAFTTVEPWIGRLRRGGATVLADGADVWGPDYPDTVLVARRSFVESDPGTVTTMIRAMLAAQRMIHADPGHALATVARRFPGFSPVELLAGLRGQPPGVDIRGIEEVILGRWATVRRLQGRPVPPAPAGLIDLRCLVAALDRRPSATRPVLERNSDVV